MTGVSKVYRIVKTDERLMSSNASTATVEPFLHRLNRLESAQEHIVVVEFMRRKLAFAAQRPLKKGER